jgi:putative CocE/NonD family hydrolase
MKRFTLAFAMAAAAAKVLTATAQPDTRKSSDLCSAYVKSEVMIPMRDGVELQTEIYRPLQNHGPAGVLLDRTPYMVTNSDEACPARVAALFDDVWEDGYILVRQAVRGRGRSGGVFVLGAPLRHSSDAKGTDEATDAWDTVDWLVKNVPDNNGKVGLVGISYDAKLAIMAASKPHPAVVAVSAQASPIDQWIGDDFWRNGVFRLNYTFEHAVRLDLSRAQQPFAFDNADTFEWYLDLGPLKNANDRYFRGKSEFWNELQNHERHDEYWQSRNLTDAVGKIHVPVLTTGGWWDAEDFYGSMQIARILDRSAQRSKFRLVVGPWTHGGWTNPLGAAGRSLGQIDFGSDTARYWRHEVERPWLAHWILGGPDPALPAALSFRTGANQWMRYDRWPPEPARGILTLYLTCEGVIRFDRPSDRPCRKSYVSDPANPVPYLPRPIGPLYGGANVGGNSYQSPWNAWEAQDQRFSTRRPDTLLFTTGPLSDDLAITGGAELTLDIATTGTDGDFIAKLLDIYPGVDPENPELGDYHLMLDHSVIAGRYLRSFTRPEPLVPGRVYELRFHFMDKDHTFKKGHRIAIQVQSSMFPLMARNPQTYVESVFAATQADFRPARIELIFGPTRTNRLRLPGN